MSRIQKAIKASKASHDEKSSRPRGMADSFRNAVKSNPIIKMLLPADIDTAAMAHSRILPGIDDKHVTTAYKILRTRIQRRMRANNWNSLLVTGPGPNEGKTITAANLAISIAKDVNQSAILVDLDLQRPSLAEYFGLTIGAGLGEFLRGEAEIEDIVYAPAGLERLAMIPNQQPIENSSDLIASPRMHELIAWTREQDNTTLTIFDMPPMLISDDVLAFVEYVDSVLVVVAQGLTDRRALEKTVELLGDNEILGIVLNRSSHIVGHTDYSYY
ncbi:MAG: exopolysaccharide biosynthesis protein [Bacteroidetes bacterium]|nr:MAG: exopolysaccharide biosynthesis protein [Bacteroidota bacterium]